MSQVRGGAVYCPSIIFKPAVYSRVNSSGTIPWNYSYQRIATSSVSRSTSDWMTRRKSRHRMSCKVYHRSLWAVRSYVLLKEGNHQREGNDMRKVKCSVIHLGILTQSDEARCSLPSGSEAGSSDKQDAERISASWSRLTCWTLAWTCRWCFPPAGSSAARRLHDGPVTPRACRMGTGIGRLRSASLLLWEGRDWKPVVPDHKSHTIQFGTSIMVFAQFLYIIPPSKCPVYHIHSHSFIK